MSEIRRNYSSQIRPPFFRRPDHLSGSAGAAAGRSVNFFSASQFGSVLSTLQGLHGGWTSFLGGATANQTFTPFWSSLLEGQNSNTAMTMKFPSDNEDGGSGGTKPPSFGGGDGPPMMTMKFPSDNEDGGSGGTKPPSFSGGDGPPMMTMKFPSDNEDGGGGTKPPSFGGGDGPPMMTMKFPSDNEDGGGAGRFG